MCPLTIHALLHIADGIEEMGPVWTYWAFPTERYCGRLQPAIKSRRFPYASISAHVVAMAQLAQIKLRYNLEEELSLAPKKMEEGKGQFSHPDCTYPVRFDFGFRGTHLSISDKHCILLRPRRLSSTITKSMLDKIAICLSTRFNKPLNVIRRYLKQDSVEQWGRLRRLEGGDDMYAASLVKQGGDRRDATFIRVSDIYILID